MLVNGQSIIDSDGVCFQAIPDPPKDKNEESGKLSQDMKSKGITDLGVMGRVIPG